MITGHLNPYPLPIRISPLVAAERATGSLAASPLSRTARTLRSLTNSRWCRRQPPLRGQGRSQPPHHTPLSVVPDSDPVPMARGTGAATPQPATHPFPVVPSTIAPHSDAGPVPMVGRGTGAATSTNLPPLTQIRHSPTPSSPTPIGDPGARGYPQQPATHIPPSPVVPSIVARHSDAGQVPTVDEQGGGATPVPHPQYSRQVQPAPYLIRGHPPLPQPSSPDPRFRGPRLPQ